MGVYNSRLIEFPSRQTRSKFVIRASSAASISSNHVNQHFTCETKPNFPLRLSILRFRYVEQSSNRDSGTSWTKINEPRRLKKKKERSLKFKISQCVNSSPKTRSEYFKMLKVFLKCWNDVFFFFDSIFHGFETRWEKRILLWRLDFFSIIYRPSWNLRSHRARLKCNSNVSSFFPLTGAGIENRDTEADTAS